MTDLPPENTDRPEETPEPVSNGAPVARAAPEREASVRLGTTDERGDAALMDPANESLADALKITFRLVQFSMVILAGLFVFSGFQTVNEGERGVSVLFGKTRAIDLEPGFRFSAPYPFGELVKVQTGTLSPQINRAFWPFVNLGEEDGPVENLPRGRRLNAARDGSLITADLNLAHTQWRVNYRRDRVAEFVTNVIPEAEGAIVRHAVERAIVQAMAETTIDDLLRPEGGTRALAQRVQETAQRMLDEIAGAGPDGVTQGIGVQIEQVDLARKIPPSSLIRQFAAVITARSEAQRARTDAEARRGETLNAVAGTAAGSLLEQIEQYEVVVETGRRDEAEQILATIDGILQGTITVVDGQPIPGVVSGEVTQLLAEAESDRASTVNRARADLALFEAKLAQFNANPSLMISRDWAGAYSEFLAKPFVQTMLLPEGVSGELRINEDPDIIKEIDRAQKRAEALEAAEQRELDRRLDRFRTQRGIQREEE